MTKTSSVYCWTNKLDGKQYIGITSNPVYERYYKHVWCSENEKKYPLHRSIAKYGLDNFVFEVLHTDLTVEESGEIEKSLIISKGTKAPKGYNLSDGGIGPSGFKWSEESKNKLKGRVIGTETREKLRNHNLGKRNSEESKIKNSIASKGENNPMYGKKHSIEVIAKLSGKNNPMYGRVGATNPFFGQTHSTAVKELLSAKKQKVTPELIESMKELRSKGLSYGKIAKIIGLGFGTVQRYLSGYYS